MWRELVFISITSLMEQYNAQIHCKDIHQHVVSQGLHYIPGTNPCTLCVCDKGGPKWCKSVLCAPPQNCKSFQVGTLCCEFKCLDDILTAHDDTYDVALRFIASAVTAILSLSLLFFLFHRLKRRKVLVHQNQQLNEDQRSLNSIGYIAGSLGYLPESIGYLGSSNNELEFHYEESNPHYTLWKPPGNYFPRGEAPPPYEEAVRTAQLESDLINTQIRLANSLSNTLTVPTRRIQNAHESVAIQSNIPCRHEYPQPALANNNINNNNAQYANVIIQNVSVHNPEESAAKSDEFKHKTNNSSKVRSYNGQNTSKSSGVDRTTKSYENVAVPNIKAHTNSKRDRPTSSGYRNQRLQSHEYSNVNKSAKCRSDDCKLDNNARKSDKPNDVEANGVTNNLYDDLNCYENTHHMILNVPETFNFSLLKNATQYRDNVHSSHKSMQSRELRKTKTADRSDSNIGNAIKQSAVCRETPLHRTLPKNLRELLENTAPLKTDDDLSKKPHSSTHNILLSSIAPKSQAETNIKCGGDNSREVPPAPAPPSFSSVSAEQSKNSTNTDEENSFISYQCLSSSQDEDDYRSECENCKSSGFTIADDEETDVLNETMTLQRRPLENGEEVSYYRTSLTLPSSTRKSRPVVTNSNRESWFTSMQETSSSEEYD